MPDLSTWLLASPRLRVALVLAASPLLALGLHALLYLVAGRAARRSVAGEADQGRHERDRQGRGRAAAGVRRAPRARPGRWELGWPATA